MSGLSPESLVLLRDALATWMRGNGADDPALRSVLLAVATESRERGIRAEQLIVILKKTWFEMGGGPLVVPPPASGHPRLDELVTACIKAYYT